MTGSPADTAIWWLRRDLRLDDNEALFAAAQTGRLIVPVFIFDPTLLNGRNRSEPRQAFMQESLRSLAATIAERGGRLIVRRGHPAEELAKLVQETGATAVFAEEDYSPYARRRDERVAQRVPLHLVGSSAIRPPGTILKKDGTPYVVYTPFSRAWLGLPLPREGDLRPVPEQWHIIDGLPSGEIPTEPALPDTVPFPPSESEGLSRLASFIGDQAGAYDTARNMLGQQGTSRLSPYLRFGLVSARRAAVAAISARSSEDKESRRKGLKTWLDELIWRDFYIHILYHFPHVARTSFRENLRHIRWRNAQAEFDAWREGRTGYPVVDAAMRQLATTGWMHNRARMIVASFLVKDLLIDWRWGERWFMRQLVDGDLPANNGGWQWSAGTGTDAAPYFRIFNPITQGKKFDPEGDYIRHWVPELSNVEAQYIHEPSKMPPMEQQRTGCHIGTDYPAPIVDHSKARQRTLDAYAAAKEEAE
jgi:deoxyribodipyrimidine photo-lyase